MVTRIHKGNKLIQCISVASLALVIHSCQLTDRSREKQTLTGIGQQDLSEDLEKIQELKKVYFMFPSPAEMLTVIRVSELEFDKSILNPGENSENYLDQKSQSINLGIYITDLAYAALFGRQIETIDYFETVYELAQKVRVEGGVSETLMNSAKENAGNLDSLFSITNEAFVNTLNYCEQNLRQNTLLLIAAGAFIESMFIAVNLVDDYNEASELVRGLADQKYAFDNLMEMALSLSDDESVSETVAGFKPVRDFFEQLGAPPAASVTKQQGSNKLVIGSKKQYQLSEEQFNELKEATSIVRTSIVTNKI